MRIEDFLRAIDEKQRELALQAISTPIMGPGFEQQYMKNVGIWHGLQMARQMVLSYREEKDAKERDL